MMWKLFSKTRLVKKIPQGRWALIKCEVALERRIALANTDHCGPCSSHDLHEKTKIIINKNGDCVIEKNTK